MKDALLARRLGINIYSTLIYMTNLYVYVSELGELLLDKDAEQ